MIAPDLCYASINASTYECPSGHLLCPGGECAAAPTLCPTHATCPAGAVLCEDGVCRNASACPTSDISCAQGLVQCPLVGGLLCANALTDCPQNVICSGATPVRCQDKTCAASATSGVTFG